VATRESIPVPLQLRLSGPTAVHDATAAARDFAEAGGLDEADASRLAVVVEELVTNLYDHGGLGEEDEFFVELSLTEVDLRLVIGIPDSRSIREARTMATCRSGAAERG